MVTVTESDRTCVVPRRGRHGRAAASTRAGASTSLVLDALRTGPGPLDWVDTGVLGCDLRVYPGDGAIVDPW